MLENESCAKHGLDASLREQQLAEFNWSKKESSFGGEAEGSEWIY